ncbi:MAG: hypothetical protein HYY06_17370 [Deltaproteobacteria bacterium]|nr:hypothetical protein [Deltaproteobacteria bacterium]
MSHPADPTRLDGAAARLVADGLVRADGDHRVATRRWHGAMARAAVRLMASGDEGADLRVPIASALVELYGPDLDDDELADMVEVLLPIEAIGVPAAAQSSSSA